MCPRKKQKLPQGGREYPSVPPEGRLCPVVEQRQEVEEAKDNSGMESTDKHGEQQPQRIHLQQDTQEVGRSGCFLIHSDSVASMGILSQDIVASGVIPATKRRRGQPASHRHPNHRQQHDWPTITTLRTKSRKGRSSDDIPMHANAINAIVREFMIFFLSGGLFSAVPGEYATASYPAIR